MAVNLKPVDVAVIGLGAAGGVAVLPLTRAGLKVAGIEAGTWIDPHTYKPDEIYNNVRGLVTSVPKAKREIPTFRTGDTARARQGATHPMAFIIGWVAPCLARAVSPVRKVGISRLALGTEVTRPRTLL